MPQTVSISSIEHQDPAPSGAEELHSDGAAFNAKFIPLVAVCIAHITGTAHLMPPMLVHQFAEQRCVSAFERLLALMPKFLDVMQILEQFAVRVVGSGVLVLEDVTRAAGEAGKKQEQVILKIEQRIHAEPKWLSLNRIVLVEGKAGDATIGCNVLILLANRFAKTVDFDMTGQLREFVRMQQTFSMSVQRLNQSGCKAARRAKTSPCRNIRQSSYFNLRSLQVQRLDHLANDWMVPVFHLLYVFQLRIL